MMHPSPDDEIDRLRRYGISVAGAMIVHFGIFVLVAFASWGVVASARQEAKDPDQGPDYRLVDLSKAKSNVELEKGLPCPKPPDESPVDLEDLISRTPEDPSKSIPPVFFSQEPLIGSPDRDRKSTQNAKGSLENPDLDSLFRVDLDGPDPRFRVSKGDADEGPGTGRGIYGDPEGPGVRPPYVPGPARSAVRLALEWLQRHQNPDGRWSSDRFCRQCAVREAPCGGPGEPGRDIGVTGLSLAAYLGKGYTHRNDTPYKGAIDKGLRFLRGVQLPDGRFGKGFPGANLYDHALATLALSEAYGLSRDADLRQPVEAAVRLLLAAQNPGKAWRYDDYNQGGAPPEDGPNDTSVTGWVVMALHAAQLAGTVAPLEIRAADFERAYAGANAWLDEVMQEEKTGEYRVTFGYSKRGVFVNRKPYVTTAAGALIRQFTGQSRGVDGAVAVLLEHPPDFADANFYEWYYASEVLHQAGRRVFDGWERHLRPAVCDHLHQKGGCVAGSMDPCDRWGSSGGRVYATACAALCMEVYGRHAIQAKAVPADKKDAAHPVDGADKPR